MIAAKVFKNDICNGSDIKIFDLLNPNDNFINIFSGDNKFIEYSITYKNIFVLTDNQNIIYYNLKGEYIRKFERPPVNEEKIYYFIVKNNYLVFIEDNNYNYYVIYQFSRKNTNSEELVFDLVNVLYDNQPKLNTLYMLRHQQVMQMDDNNNLFINIIDNKFILINVLSGVSIHKIDTTNEYHRKTYIRFSKDGKYIFFSRKNISKGIIYVFSKENLDLITKITTHTYNNFFINYDNELNIVYVRGDNLYVDTYNISNFSKNRTTYITNYPIKNNLISFCERTNDLFFVIQTTKILGLIGKETFLMCVKNLNDENEDVIIIKEYFEKCELKTILFLDSEFDKSKN